MSGIQVTEAQMTELDRLRKAAEGRILSSPTKFVVMAIGVFGALAAPVGAPVAAVVAMPLVYSAIKRAVQNGDNAAYLRETGLFAHLLNERELIKFDSIVGKAAVIAHLKEAFDDGKNLSGAAIDYLECAGVDTEPQTLKALLQGEPEKKRLGDEPRTEGGSVHPSPVSYLMGSRLRTSLIVSVSGGGKDILLSNALRAFLAAHAGFKVVVADCKDDPKEYGYYDGLANTSVHRLNVAIASDGEVIEWVDRWIEEFLHLPEKALLICNEGTLIRAKSKRYIQAIDGLVSSGDSREKYAWESGQSAHTDDLGINGAARSRFRTLIIGLKGEEMQIESVLAAKFVADSARNMEDVRSMMIRSPVDRAWSDGQRWFAMPELENHSGYDRDSRSTIATPQQRLNREKLEGLWQETNETKFVSDSSSVPRSGDERDEMGTKSETNETTQPQAFQPFDIEAVTKFVSSLGTNETTLFAAILGGFKDGLSPSDIVKDSLKLKKQYMAGRSLSIYLIRKYGDFDLLMHFRKWLEET